MNNKLRIATLGIHHETNTFARNKTTLEEFNRSGLQTYAVQRGQQYADDRRVDPQQRPPERRL